MAWVPTITLLVLLGPDWDALRADVLHLHELAAVDHLANVFPLERLVSGNTRGDQVDVIDEKDKDDETRQGGKHAQRAQRLVLLHLILMFKSCQGKIASLDVQSREICSPCVILPVKTYDKDVIGPKEAELLPSFGRDQKLEHG